MMRAFYADGTRQSNGVRHPVLAVVNPVGQGVHVEPATREK
jgi:hypothetical protein